MVAEVNFQKEANTPWGFRLTGGPKFGMPLTVFEVEEGGRAYQAGIRLGDVLVKINGMEADRLNLEDAHRMIAAAGNNINLSVSNLEDQELKEIEELAKAVASNLTDQEDTDTEVSHEIHKSEASEPDTSEIQETSDSEAPRTETSVEDTSRLARSEISETEELESMSKASDNESETEDVNVEDEDEHYVDVNSLPLRPPRPAPEPERAVRKCWHPVMLDTNPPPVNMSKASESDSKTEEEDEEEQYVDVNSLPLRPPRPAPESERAVRKCWHPVMLETNPPPIIEEATGELRAEQPRKHYQEVKTSFTLRLLDEKPKPAEVDKIPEPDAGVTLQLRSMQRQLNQLVQLPAAIQATLQAVSSHIETLLPGPPAPPQHQRNHDTLAVQSDDSGEFLEEDYTESLEGITEEEEEWSDMELQRPASQSESNTPSPPPSPTEDDVHKTAKMEKLETLNKCWPWADNAKPIYKIAEHYEPVYAKCINKKVKWLETKITEDQILARNLKGV